MEPKAQLAELIDAFAAAKATGNETLQRIALGPLQAFIEQHDFVPTSPMEVPEVQPEQETE